MIKGHTPGPWQVRETPESSNQSFVVQVGRCRVSVSTDNDLADATLIAAAPDLLEALRKMLDRYAEDEWLDSPIDAEARAAIAKAVQQ